MRELVISDLWWQQYVLPCGALWQPLRFLILSWRPVILGNPELVLRYAVSQVQKIIQALLQLSLIPEGGREGLAECPPSLTVTGPTHSCHMEWSALASETGSNMIFWTYFLLGAPLCSSLLPCSLFFYPFYLLPCFSMLWGSAKKNPNWFLSTGTRLLSLFSIIIFL